MKQTRAGYTLIEILIVIFIISIVSAVALLSFGRSQHQRYSTLAGQVAQMLTLAEEQAMLQPAVLGMSVDNQVIQFYEYQPAQDSKQTARWIVWQDKPLQPHPVPDDIALTLKLNEVSQHNDKDITPSIVISASGDVTPFTLYIGKQGEAPAYAVQGEADGTITSQQLP